MTFELQGFWPGKAWEAFAQVVESFKAWKTDVLLGDPGKKDDTGQCICCEELTCNTDRGGQECFSHPAMGSQSWKLRLKNLVNYLVAPVAFLASKREQIL